MSSFSKKEALLVLLSWFAQLYERPVTDVRYNTLFVFSILIVVSCLIPFNYLRRMFFVERGLISETSGKINIDVSGKLQKH